MITTDKCYENREWLHGYREEDPLGGYDPYSSSKAACELAIASWRRSFFSPQPLKSFPSSLTTRHSPLDAPPPVLIASARAGNVIGGGDWAQDRIVPDCIRSLENKKLIPVRNKTATRPWQHVLEPLSGYLLLAAKMMISSQFEVDSCAQPSNQQPTTTNQQQPPPPLNPSSDLSAFQPFSVSAFSSPTSSLATRHSSLVTSSSLQPAELCSAFNFGPALNSNRTVAEIVQEILKHWPGEWQDKSDPHAPHEAGKLNLATDKAFHLLGWQPRWDFATTIEKTVGWYRSVNEGADPGELTRQHIIEYSQS